MYSIRVLRGEPSEPGSLPDVPSLASEMIPSTVPEAREVSPDSFRFSSETSDTSNSTCSTSGSRDTITEVLLRPDSADDESTCNCFGEAFTVNGRSGVCDKGPALSVDCEKKTSALDYSCSYSIPEPDVYEQVSASFYQVFCYCYRENMWNDTKPVHAAETPLRVGVYRDFTPGPSRDTQCL